MVLSRQDEIFAVALAVALLFIGLSFRFSLDYGFTPLTGNAVKHPPLTFEQLEEGVLLRTGDHRLEVPVELRGVSYEAFLGSILPDVRYVFDGYTHTLKDGKRIYVPEGSLWDVKKKAYAKHGYTTDSILHTDLLIHVDDDVLLRFTVEP